MSKENEKEFFEAWNKYSENFNNLPIEVRKMLPDWFKRYQEVTMLIKEQENVLQHLKARQKSIKKKALEWYRKEVLEKTEE